MDTKQMIEVMQAHVDGKDIELRSRTADVNSRWHTCTKSPVPLQWNWARFEYRIKPIKKKVRVYETIHGYFLVSTALYGKLENDPVFHRWITDWVEVIDEK